jgi:tRNA modification GTPase
MTGKGTGAIATVQLFGGSAETVIKGVFKPAKAKPPIFKPGKILLGVIHNGTETIDQVTIGCEGPDNFAIHCHGNPLIVEMIMQLLVKNGAEAVTSEQLLTEVLSAQKNLNTVALEAKLTQPKAKTIQGTKIIVNQIDAGLSKKIEYWQKNISKLSLDVISAEADEILENTQIAKLIIFGCKVALIGPPNTGKSTLLNFLAGRQKAIVTDIKGTTRDWVSAQCQIDPLFLELIDTAGLAEAPVDDIEKESQQKSVEILQRADLVLLVLDNSQTAEQLDEHLIEKIGGKKVLTVLNKIDLSPRFDTGKLPRSLSNTVQISAKYGNGIESLCDKIRQICGVADFDLHSSVCFTNRQENLLEKLKNAKSKEQAASLISELLNGPLSV